MKQRMMALMTLLARILAFAVFHTVIAQTVEAEPIAFYISDALENSQFYEF